MDYVQTSERYRRREMRGLMTVLLWLLVIGCCIWLGWFWGYSSGEGDSTSHQDQILRLTQQNDRLEQNLAQATSALEAEQERRRAAEYLLGGDDPSTPQHRLSQAIADYLARGIDEDAISLALGRLATPLKCRPVEAFEVAVATSFFAGQESIAQAFGGGMQIFMEGEASGETVWFDPSQPVSMRIAYLNGEKITTATLPFEASITTDSWLIRVHAAEAQLQGYVTLTLEHCSLS